MLGKEKSLRLLRTVLPFFGFLLFFANAFAVDMLTIEKGRIVEIINYDHESKMYAVADLHFSGQGPFFTTLEKLSKTTEGIDLEKALTSPNSIKKKQFVLKADLQIIDEYDRQKYVRLLKLKQKNNSNGK